MAGAISCKVSDSYSVFFSTLFHELVIRVLGKVYHLNFSYSLGHLLLDRVWPIRQIIMISIRFKVFNKPYAFNALRLCIIYKLFKVHFILDIRG